MRAEPVRQEASQTKKQDWLPVFLLILVQVANGLRNMPQLSFYGIYLEEQLRLDPVMISTVIAGAQVAGMITALLGGAISIRLGSKWMLAFGLALSAVCSLAFLSPSVWMTALLWFAGGMGLAMVTVASASYLTRISGRSSLGMLSAVFAMSTTAGGALGNPIAGWLIDRWGFGAFAWGGLAVSALTTFVVILWMDEIRQEGAGAASPRSFTLVMLDTLRLKNLRALIGLRGLPTIFYGMLMVLIPLLLNNLSGSKAVVAAYGTTNLVVASAAQLVAGRLADRWGARGPSLVSYAALILAGLGLALWANTVWGLFVFGVMGIAAAWALATLLFVWVSDGLAKPDHPAAFGLLHAVWSVSMIAGSVLGGWFVTIQPGLPFLIAGLLNVGSLFLITAYYLRWIKETS